MRFPVRIVRLTILSIICLTALAAETTAQYKIELQTCEDLKITKKQYGVNIVETATCINPTKFFRPKGTLRNVFVLAMFPAVPTGAGITFMITKNDADGEYVQNMDYSATPQHTTAYSFRLAAGVYFVYIIGWGKRESLEHRGNLTEYFAKMTLTVK